MSAVNVTQVLPTQGQNEELPFNSPFSFSVEYECLYALQVNDIMHAKFKLLARHT